MSTATSTPNIRKLAEFIYNTGRSKQIMSVLELALTAGLADDLRTIEQRKSNQETAAMQSESAYLCPMPSRKELV